MDISSWGYTLNKEHGFGIYFTTSPNKYLVFSEDGTLLPWDATDTARDTVKEVSELLRISDPGRFSYSYWNTNEKELDAFVKGGECSFALQDDGSIDVTLKTGKTSVNISVSKHIRTQYYRNISYDAECSCRKENCVHIRAAGSFCRTRILALKHAYVTSRQPVDKSLFLEDSLFAACNDGDIGDFSEASMEKLRLIVSLADAAQSDDYYQALHAFVLRLSPYYDYDAHYLEDYYAWMILALFEDKGYYHAVIEPGGFADPEDYEGRQRRSNRACFKRILKEYGRVRKEMENKGDYSDSDYKEFLLKYRKDDKGLLRYYAVGKEKLETEDLPYLLRIAGDPQADTGQISTVAEKLNVLGGKEAEKVCRELAARLPRKEMVALYGRMKNISLSVEEIRSFTREEQQELIFNTPLTKNSFLYTMDELLNDKDDILKGRFILSTLSRMYFSREKGLKEAVLEKTALLSDNRLLLSYVAYRLNLALPKKQIREGAPEKELKNYFACDYHIVNKNDSFKVCFEVTDPDSPQFDLISMEEKNGEITDRRFLIREIPYPDEVVRKVCLEGKEEAYQKALEKNQDAVDTFLFEKNNRKFSQEYKRLCESIQAEKIILRPAEKAKIDWLVYRESGSNVLAFRVGNTKLYVVKDASLFIDAFRSAQTIEYGKDLILTHDPDNLEESDAVMIRQLMAARYTKGRPSDPKNKRYIRVNDSLLGSLLENFTGRTIWFNDEPCLLRMEKQTVRLKITGDYVLDTDLSAGQIFLNVLGKGYLVTRRKDAPSLVIDRAAGTAEEIGLIELVYRNPSIRIKPILKDFKKNIYSRFFELFDVDKKVSEDFRLSEIRLNTYFDFERGIITRETKILKDDKPVSAEKLSERIDLAKYDLLEHYLSELGFVEGRLEEESRVLSFFKMDFTRLKSLTNVYLSDRLLSKELKSVGRPVIRVTYKNDILSAFLEKSEYTEEELEKIISAIRRKKKYILLTGDRIVDLDSEAARDFEETVKDFGLDPKDLYQKKKISMVTAIKAFAHEKSCRIDKYLRDMIDEIRSFKEAEIKIPALHGELRDYQVEGFNWLSILSRYGMGGILADDMGLGKTIQVIALIKSDNTRKPSLVVCPKSLVFNWVSEFSRFDGRTPVVAVYGPDSSRTSKISSIDYKKKAVYITSYDSLRNDIAKYSGEFNYGILDEAQYIKNVNALKTKSVKELKVNHRFALTGTPIENSVVDLWSIFDYIMPGYFEELSCFKENDTTAIARKAGPFILRRVKEDVLEDLPPKYERILSAEMSKGQRKVYDAYRMKARKALEDGGKAFDILPYLTRLRQICVDPGMFVDNYSSGSGKLDMLEKLIPEYLNANHRILIFSQFVKALEAVGRILDKLGIPAYFLSGATSAKDRIEMMDSFNNGSGKDVFLVSLKAGGTGLNLTGADTVIHLDPWWNAAAENQASDRTHRIGQKRNVEVIKLIAEDSIEQRVVELQEMKKEVIRQVISDDDGSVTSASLEDIAFVLE